MNAQCRIETRPAQSTVAVRTRTPVSAMAAVIGPIYGRIMAYVGEMGAATTGAPFVAYYNMDMADLDIEVGFSVDRTLPGRGDLSSGALPAGDYATCMHIGPYDQVGPAYAALTAFVQQQGRTPTGVAYEFYFNSPQDTPPEQLQTLVMFPLV
ncbi:MAG: GyrI-like domain-containing protein [Caldilinea sp.]